MPINIYREGSDDPKIAWLCDDSWSLPFQIDILQQWLESHGKMLKKDKYVADIGFKIRENASGGGAALSPESMKIMSDVGMWLYVSEYADEFPQTHKP